MGSKLESVLGNIEKVNEMGDQAIESADSAVSDITRIRQLLEEVPQDGDDEIVTYADLVAEQSTRETADYMQTDVEGQLEAAEETGRETVEEASDQQSKSETAADVFGRISAERFGGKGADAQASALESAEQFRQSIEQVGEMLEQHRKDFESALDEILND